MSCECDSDSSSIGDEAKKKVTIITRPNASPGYWLCCLVPLAFGITYLRLRPVPAYAANTSQSYILLQYNSYQMMTIAAFGMCIESLCFFMYMFMQSGLLVKLIISFIPGICTALLYNWLFDMSLGWNIFWGFAVTFSYQSAYIRVMRGFPRCFTYGEACIIVQGIMLFVMNCIMQLPSFVLHRVQMQGKDFAQLNAIMMSALFWLLMVCWLLGTFKCLRNPYCFYLLLFVLMLAVKLMPVTKPLPIIKLFQFITSDRSRINIIIFYLALVGITICAIAWQLHYKTHKASTRMRKVFHALAVLVFTAGLIYQYTLLYIASGVALAVFTVLELIRVLEIPPLANALKSAFASFSDEKDAGALAVTPFCLLIGISLPLWLSVSTRGSDILESAVGPDFLRVMSGILTIGIGDTAASVIGSKYGSFRWRATQRSLEGTFAYVITIATVIYTFYIFDCTNMSHEKWTISVTATLVTSLVEALTNQIDNLVLPLIFYIIISII